LCKKKISDYSHFPVSVAKNVFKVVDHDGPMSSTRRIAALGALRIRLGAPVVLELKAQPTKVTEPAEKVLVATTVTPV
jgi:hypothetical protein